MAARCAGGACWPAFSSTRAVQISRIIASASSSGARFSIVPSAPMNASAAVASSPMAAR
jgi:hypothetical protein